MALSLFLSILILTATQGASCQKLMSIMTHDDICAVTGSSVVMPCSFSHPPNLQVQKVYWVINPEKAGRYPDILTTQGYKGRVQYSTNINEDCTLTISNVRVTDTADYYARILTNKDEKHLSSKVKLTVTDLAVHVSGPAIEGQEIKLSCKSNCILGQSSILWKKNGKILPDSQTNNEVILPNISTEDEGNYSCALKVQDDHPSPPLELDVMHPPKNTSISVTPAGIHEGTSVTLTCSSDAKPPVQNYTWYKTGKATPSLVGSGKIYSIANITSEHSGHYYCMVKNQHGGSNSTAVYLDVQTVRLDEPDSSHQHVALTAGGAVSFIAIALLVALAVVMNRRKKIIRSSSESRTNRDMQDAPENNYDITYPVNSAPTLNSSDSVDVQYSSVQFQKSSGEEASLYSTVQMPKPQQQQEEVAYATVNV